MGTQVVTFAFPSSADSFTASVGGNTTASWQSADGTVNGCLQFRISGRSKTNANNTYTRTLTFEDMGVPAGATVTGITGGSAYYKVREWNAGNVPGNNMDGVFLTPSGSSAITIAAATAALNGTTAWVQYNGTNSTGLSLASSTSCVVRWQADLSTAANNGAFVTLAVDTITFTVTYSLPATANPTTVVGTASVEPLTVSNNATADIGGVAGAGEAGPIGFGTYGPGLSLLWSLNLDYSDIANITADAVMVSGAGQVGTPDVYYAQQVEIEGVGGAGAVGTVASQSVGGNLLLFGLNLDSGPAAQAWGPGLSLLWSLNLDGVPGDVAFKYTTDTFTPVFGEDPVDTAYIEDDTEAFTPVFLDAGFVQLSGSVSTQIPNVSGTGEAGDVSATAGCTATITSVDAFTDVSSFIQIRAAVSVTLESVAGLADHGVIGVSANGSISVGITNPAIGFGEVGTLEAGSSSNVDVTLTSVEAAMVVGILSAGAPVNIDVTGVDCTGELGDFAVVGAANVDVSGVAGTGVLSTFIINPGQEGSIRRRARPARGRRR